jgi:solute:Na+ symporter, SSS family
MPRAAAVLALLAVVLSAGEFPRTLDAYRGRTPKVDGVISPGEYADATRFTGVAGWTAQFTPTTNPEDLSVTGYVKHDGKFLYFAFDVTDDVLYGIDTPRWLPDNNPRAHEISPAGFPWFGDEMEVLLNAANQWNGDESAAGNGSSWQMVCSLTKSQLQGTKAGGVLAGEPRRDPSAWNTYVKWIEQGHQTCAAKAKKRGYALEWRIAFTPCLEVRPGVYYNPGMGDKPMGLNIALGDLDEKEKGAGNFGNFHHEDWWAGVKDKRTQLRHWGTIWIRSAKRP